MAKRRGRPNEAKAPPGPFRGAWTQNGHLLPKARWLLYVLGGGAILMACISVAEEIPVLALGKRGQADVVAIQPDGPDVYRAELEIAGVGVATTVRLNRYRRIPPLRVGQRLPVAYTRNDAATGVQAVPLNATARWPGTTFAFCFGAFMLWLSRRRR